MTDKIPSFEELQLAAVPWKLSRLKWPYISLSEKEQAMARAEHRRLMGLDRLVHCPHCGGELDHPPAPALPASSTAMPADTAQQVPDAG